MEIKFKKTSKIKEIEKTITSLENDLEDNNEKLKEVYQKEFDKQFNLVIGKTIIKFKNGTEYVYAGLSEKYMCQNWVEGFKIKKNGNASTLKQLLYDDWKKTDKEYLL